ncbi:MAG TPA: hypothetical protein VFR03_15165 [Thermoanaerobaculia bacterium]|nr:hypothetical protein [Thermoanaerobaculia bacterium]
MRKYLALLVLPLALGATAAPALAQGSCFPAATHLCLSYGRFQVDVDWMLPGGIAGKGQAVPLTDDTGSFWFFDNANLELVIKVLDGRAVNGHFWVYYGGLSDVEYRITVTDTVTGLQEIYVNPAGRLAGGSDVAAFDPEPPPVDLLAAGPGLPERTPSRLGPEMRVNVTTAGDQREPAVAAGPDGGFMVVWKGPPAGLQGRLYDSAGRPRGGEIVLAASAQPEQPRVAADVSGRFMVVWNGEGRVKARVFGPDGQPASEEIAVGFNPQQQGLPDVVANPAGGFLAGWPEYGNDTLHLQRFSALGKPVGSEVELARRGSDVRLAAYPAGGGFVLAWTESVDVLETNVRVLRLDGAARPVGVSALANFDVARRAGYHYAPVPVVHPDGGFSVVWTTALGTLRPHNLGLYARRYGADGQPAGLVLQVVEGFRTGDWKGNAVALPSGQVMVLWYQDGQPADIDGGTFARLFDASWSPLGSSFRVNTYTQDLQILPAAAADAAGNVVAAWTSTVPTFPIPVPPGPYGPGQDGDGSGVFAQRFTTAICAGTDQLCLGGGRFRVEVQYTDPRSGQPQAAHAAPLTGDTGAFWFFGPVNAELLIKVLDGRPVNGHYWVFYGALSDVEYTITVTDTVTGKRRTYHNEPHHQGSNSDVTAFTEGS